MLFALESLRGSFLNLNANNDNKGFSVTKLAHVKSTDMSLYPVFVVGALHSVALPHQESSNSLKHENTFITTMTTWEVSFLHHQHNILFKTKYLHLFLNMTFNRTLGFTH